MLAVLVSTFAAMLGLGIVGPLIPVYAEDLGATGIGVGFIFSGFAIARVFFDPVAGRLSDRHGRKRYICVGLVLYTLSSVGYMVATSVSNLIAVRVLNGVASSMVLPVAMAYVADLSPRGQEGKYMGMFTRALFIGFGVGPLLGGGLIDHAGYDVVFASMGGLCFLSLILAIVMLKPRAATIQQRESAKFMDVLRNRIILAVLMHRLVNALGRGMIIAFLALFGVLELNLTLADVGLLITINLVLMGFLQGPCGKLADRYNRVRLVVIGSIIGAVSLGCFPLATGFWSLLALNILSGAGGALVIPTTSAMCTIEGRTLGQGNVMGLFNTAMSAGMVFGPLLGGLIYDGFNIGAVFVAGALVNGFAVVAFLVLARGQTGPSTSTA